MKIGVPKEVKTEEYRVGLVPDSVRQLVQRGHCVCVESNAASAIGFTDEDYLAAGAEVLADAATVFQQADMIVKVKEPQPSEYSLLRENQILFTYLHLAPDPQQAKGLINSGCVAFAYETVTDSKGGLPLLMPMSQVAGRLSIQKGAQCLEKTCGGNGLLLGGVPGVPSGKVVIIGGGVVGTSAMRMAMGREAQVYVLDNNLDRLALLDQQYENRLNTIYSTTAALEEHVASADLVIGAVLSPGKAAPKLVTRQMIASMQSGSVVVDVSIDQGGCFETSRPTSHREPTFEIDGVIHYCVTNMPGAVPRTSTLALNNAVLPFAAAIADKGYEQAIADDPHLANGLNVKHGRIAHSGVAMDLGMQFINHMVTAE